VKYAVFGSAGQLGRDLCPRLDGQVVPLTRDRADLTREDDIRKALLEIQPQAVINCAAYNFVDRAESEPDQALATNAWAVGKLARACSEIGATLVHFSSDYVFGLEADRQRPYEVTDLPGPVSIYGVSKLAGEYMVRAHCPRHFIIRTCGLYGVWGSGGKGGNFVETMLRLASQGKPLRVVADQFCTPSYTVDIAEATAALLQTHVHGLYHLTNADSCTWYELAKTTFELSGTKADLSPITSAEFAAPAKRPPYSVLSMAHYRRLGLAAPRPWRQALSAYLEERQLERGESTPG
jgi:dTDP-4-dehydrorhamnose reductase